MGTFYLEKKMKKIIFVAAQPHHADDDADDGAFIECGGVPALVASSCAGTVYCKNLEFSVFSMYNLGNMDFIYSSPYRLYAKLYIFLWHCVVIVMH